MSANNSIEFDSLFQLLREYNWELSNNVPDDLKCVKCHRIVVDSCQGTCECRFCRACIAELQAKGNINCPGNTDDCKYEYLAEFQDDIIGNRKIAKLVLRCPEESCLDQYRLVDLGRHLSNCSRRSVRCPFYNFGCGEQALSALTIDEHLQRSHHSEMLATAMTTLRDTDEKQRSEIDALKLDGENNTNEIAILKKTFASKEDSIQALRNEMASMKAQFSGEIDRLGRAVDRLAAQRDEPTIEQLILPQKATDKYQQQSWRSDKCDKTSEVKQQYHPEDSGKFTPMEVLSRQLEYKFDEITFEIDSRFDAMRQEWKRDLAAAVGSDLEGSSDAIPMPMAQKEPDTGYRKQWPESKSFEWSITNLNKIDSNVGHVCSDVFSGAIHTYQMRLQLNAYVTNISVCLRVYDVSGPTATMTWPFEADITISIINNYGRTLVNAVTERCTIQKPPKNSFNCSKPFVFSLYDYLTGKTLSNFDVQCLVNFA